MWKLNATILIAQSQAKIGDEENLRKAIENFDKAYEMTEKQSKNFILNWTCINFFINILI